MNTHILDYIIWDSDVTGFGIRVRKAGSRKWIFVYRSVTNTQRKMTIGNVGTIDLDDARSKAKVLAGEVADGRDPVWDREESRKNLLAPSEQVCMGDEMSAGELFELYFQNNDNLGKRTLYNQRGLFEREIQPILDNVPATVVTDDQIQAIVDNIKETRNTTARQVGELARCVYNWGLRTKIDGNKVLSHDTINPALYLTLPQKKLVDNSLDAPQITIF
ncbi:MAG: DUF4102 domain-containing protein, partial [Magnetovibrio sp.]|nr:DUF4102 domain-containing protein [Magnetovibrio sp.]